MLWKCYAKGEYANQPTAQSRGVDMSETFIGGLLIGLLFGALVSFALMLYAYAEDTHEES